MNNKNITLQRHNTQNIRLILIASLLAFSMFFVTINIAKNDEVIAVRGNTPIPIPIPTSMTAMTITTATGGGSYIESETSVTETTTTSIPVTLNDQLSNTNSHVSNYFNAWELTKVNSFKDL